MCGHFRLQVSHNAPGITLYSRGVNGPKILAQPGPENFSFGPARFECIATLYVWAFILILLFQKFRKITNLKYWNIIKL